MPLTDRERAYLLAIRGRLESLRTAMNDQPIPGSDDSIGDWLAYLLNVKLTLGNSDNHIAFVTTLLAKEYLSRKLPMQPFDAAKKAMGASGLDIDEKLIDGSRVIGEIKATRPYDKTRLGSRQKETFKSDFAKLNHEAARYKFFFVADEQTFSLMRTHYASDIPGVTVVQLITGEEFTTPLVLSPS